MRRGLISWSKDELPEAVLDGRVAALQAAMGEARLDAVVAYTTPARAAAVSWLAGFVPYWNQGLLVVPREGRPILVSALSNRVNDWMRRNAHVADVRNSPRIGAEAGKFVAGFCGKAAVGVVDLAHLPAAVIDDIAAEGHRIVDATALFAAVRTPTDPADLALHIMAASIAARALDGLGHDATDAAALVAHIDGEARRLGAEEVYVGVAADLVTSLAPVRLEGTAALGALSAFRVSVAYKGAWVRMTRTLAREAELRARIAAAEKQLADLLAPLPHTTALAKAKSWLIEGTRTALPLEPLAGSMIDEAVPIAAASVVTVRATIDIEGTSVLVGTPVLVGKEGTQSTRALTAP